MCKKWINQHNMIDFLFMEIVLYVQATKTQVI